MNARQFETDMIWCFAVLCAVFCSVEGRAFIDLSYTYTANLTYLPKYNDFKLNNLHRGLGDNGKYWLDINEFSIVEHAGTHIDAPRHFIRGGIGVHQIPLETLIVPGVVIDISERAAKDRDTKLTLEDVQEFESKFGEIPEHAAVIVRTGWGRYMYNKKQYLGQDGDQISTDFDKYHFPGMNADAVQWLIDERDICGVGIDSLSFDGGSLNNAETHTTLLGAGRWGLENMANLEKLPETGFTLMVMPMKIGDGTGAPSRVVAIMDDDWQALSSTPSTVSTPSATVLLTLAIKWLLSCFQSN